MTKQRMWLAMALLLVMTMVLSACAAPPDQTGGEGSEQAADSSTAGNASNDAPKVLTIGLTTDIAAIEVPYAPERQSTNASWALYDSLVFPEADGTYSPALAESWEVSEDGLTYTFHLRQDVTFHNDEPFTADSVVYSWETYSQPEVTYANEWIFVDNVEKIDDYTVQISTEEPNALLLSRVAGWAFIPPVAHAEMGLQAFAQSPIGTGPFVFKEWVKGDHLTVTANPNYWREDSPKVDEVLFKFMPESAIRVAAIQAGEIDIAPRLSAEEAETLASSDNLTVMTYPVDRVFYLAFNNMSTGIGTPIEDVKVRQALGHAIDVQTIIEAIFAGSGVRATGFLSAGNLGYVEVEPVAYDVELAKSLLAEAGYPDGFDIGMACPEAAYTNINEVCQAIQGYLSEIGVNVDLDLQEANAYWEREANKELPPLFVDSWSNTISEAYGRLEGAVGKDQSFANWEDQRLYDYLNQILTTPDVEARAALYSEMADLMRAEPPFVYLYYPQAFEGVSNRVQNYHPRGAENYFLWDVGVAE